MVAPTTVAERKEFAAAVVWMGDANSPKDVGVVSAFSAGQRLTLCKMLGAAHSSDIATTAARSLCKLVPPAVVPGGGGVGGGGGGGGGGRHGGDEERAGRRSRCCSMTRRTGEWMRSPSAATAHTSFQHPRSSGSRGRRRSSPSTASQPTSIGSLCHSVSEDLRDHCCAFAPLPPPWLGASHWPRPSWARRARRSSSPRRRRA